MCGLYGFLYYFYFYFILFYLLTSFLNHISWLFGHEETGRHLFGRRINRILKKKGDFVFRRIAHILFPWEKLVIKGKKIRKESILQKEGMRGFSSRYLGGSFGEK